MPKNHPLDLQKTHLKLSVMVSIPQESIKPSVAIRGTGVTGVLETNQKGGPKTLLYLILGVMTGFIGLLVSSLPFFRRITKSSGPRMPWEMIFVRPQTIGPFERNELVAYMLGRCGLIEQSKLFRFSPSEISYRGTPDFLFVEGLKADETQWIRYFVALKCMVLVKQISPESLDVIKRSIRTLCRPGMEFSQAEFEKLRSKALQEDINPVELRNEIDTLVAREIERA